MKRTCLIVFGVMGIAISICFLITNNSPKAAAEYIELPYRIEETNVILQRITGYNGPFVEDKSNGIVVDVAAAVIYNGGPNFLDSMVIKLQTEGNLYHFEATMIPPGESVTVLDINRCRWDRESIISCSGVTKTSARQALESLDVDVVPLSRGEVLIINNSNHTVESIIIYHKAWNEESKTYIGGITHKTMIKNFQPGDSLAVKPEFYSEGYSKIIWIE